MKNTWKILPIVASAMTCMSTITPAFAMQQPTAIYEQAVVENNDNPNSNDGANAGDQTPSVVTGSITIAEPQYVSEATDEKGNKIPATYAAHKVFDVIYDAEGTHFSYTIKEGTTFFNVVKEYATAANGMSLTKVETRNGLYYVETTDKFSAADFAKTLADFIAKNNIAGIAPTTVGTPKVPATEETAEKPATATKWEGLELGYYLVTSNTLGAASVCNLTTTKPGANINDKNTPVHLDKSITGVGEIVLKTDGTTLNVGEDVEYTLESKIPDASTYTKGFVFNMHDTWTAGLNMKWETLQVKIGDTVYKYDNENNKFLTDGVASNNLTLVKGTDENKFTVVFNDIVKNGKHDEENFPIDAKVEVTYKSTVTEAALKTNVEKNEAYIEYGHEDNTTETGKDRTQVYDIDLDVNKIAADTKKALSGAEFVLYKKLDNGNVAVYKEVEGKTTFVEMTEKELNDAVENGKIGEKVTVKTSNDEGHLKFQGFAAGTYFVKETLAPKGYNLITKDIEFKIVENYEGEQILKSITTTVNPGTDKADEKTVAVNDTDVMVNTQAQIDAGQIVTNMTVENTSTPELPETGGMGTTLLTTAGAVMMGGAFIVLTTKRRVNANK